MEIPNEPTILVVSGAQGAGKSTVATLVAESLPRAVVINGGQVQKLIVSGLSWPSGADEMDEAFVRQLRTRLKGACALAQVFADDGFVAIVEEQVVGERVDHLLEELGDRGFRFVMLAPRHEVVVERERGRGTDLHERWGSWQEEIEGRTRRIGLWLATSEQTPEETVAEIADRWDETWVG